MVWISVLIGIAVFVVLLNFVLVGSMLVRMCSKTTTAPYVSSFNKHIGLMKHNLHLQQGASLIDLGCGDGKALRFFVKTFGVRASGYDINIYAIWLGKFLNRWFGLNHLVHIGKKNFMEVDLSSFDYIYVYLLPEQLADIEDWIWSSKKKGAIVITNSFRFAHHEPYEVIKDSKGKPSIFLYRH